jgi:hypothetical protein
MCLICNPEVQRNFKCNSNSSYDIRITYYSYKNYFKICCLEDLKKISLYFNTQMATDSDGTKFSILYKSQIMIVDKNKKIKAGVYINNNVPYSYHKLTIKIKNITENILLESEILDKLNTIQNIELENNELKLENNELKLENNELKLENNELKLENNELKLEIIGTNLINNTLKKEVEYYNSLKPEYDYKEMRQTKKNLHNEYKRIYKLIKQNIGFNLI